MDTEQKEIKGKFRYEQDSKRFHRFQIETDCGIVGTVYVSKNKKAIPERIILDIATKVLPVKYRLNIGGVGYRFASFHC